MRSWIGESLVDSVVRGRGRLASVVGYAVLWNTPTTERHGGRVLAFSPCSLQVPPSVALTIDHAGTRILASTTLGSLGISQDDLGLLIAASLPDTRYGHAVLDRLLLGEPLGLSVSMHTTDFTRIVCGEQRVELIARADLTEISVVVHPAITGTTLKIVGCPLPESERTTIAAEELALADLDAEWGVQAWGVARATINDIKRARANARLAFV